MTVTVVREAPSTADRLALKVSLPDGSSVRWADDEPDVQRIPQDLTFQRSIPGGDADLNCQLLRDMRRRAGDLANYNEGKLYGPGGETVWRGYITKTPDTAFSVSPAMTGDVGRLKDDPSFRMLPVDRDLSHWTGPSAGLQIRRIAGGYHHESFSVSPDNLDSGGNGQALVINWEEAPFGSGYEELWYDPGRGLKVAAINVKPTLHNFGLPDATLTLRALVSPDDQTLGAHDIADLKASNGVETLVTFATPDRFLNLGHLWGGAAGSGTAGLTYGSRFEKVAVYGNEVPRTTNPSGGPPGVLFPDVLRAILNKINCGIGYDSDSIAVDPFVIPHLVWLTPTTADKAVLDGNKFFRNIWGVYDRLMRWQSPETFGRLWYVRRDEGAVITSNGPDSDTEFAGVIVQYDDALTGSAGVVGPPATGLVGSLGLSTATLVDSNPDLALNKWGRKRYAVLQAGLTSEPGAIRQGELFLNGVKKIAVSGSISIDNRQVFDSTGARYPAWAPKAGDRLKVVDEANAAERLIISDSGGRAPRTLTLDSPDDGLQALIERLGVVLVGVVS